MNRETHPFFAREGWPHIGIAFVVALIASYGIGGWSIIFWALFAFVLQFFRDPKRDVPSQQGIVVSPADGRVLLVEKVRDPYLARDALKISVFMNVFNVHSNRSPVSGEIKQRWYHEGTYLNASLDKASEENERMALWIQTEGEIDLVCVQIAGLIARRILCYFNAGDLLERGQRYGFIRFGSRVDLYLPANTKPRVSVGDIVAAGETIVAELPASI